MPIIDCVSDLHGDLPKLEGGDLLIIAGDLTASHTVYEHAKVSEWIKKQDYKKKVVIGGNHDEAISKGKYYFDDEWLGYLQDSETEFNYFDERFPKEDEGFLPSGDRKLKIWGSPWTKWFKGVNPSCTAFMLKTEKELTEKWELIPNDIDILVTHSPPFGILDENNEGEHCGSKSLLDRILNLPELKLHVFGHIHEGYGQTHMAYISADAFSEDALAVKPLFVNASIMNEDYEAVNKPIRVIL